MVKPFSRWLALGVVAFCLAAGPVVQRAAALPPADSPSADPRLPDAGAATERDARHLGDERLQRLYGPGNVLPIWLDERGTGLNERGALLLRRLQTAYEEGLEPARYRLAEMAAAERAGDWEALDRLLSVGLLDYVTEVVQGRAETRRLRDGYPEESFDAVAAVRELATAQDPAAVLEALAPRHPQYQRLREALAGLRERAARERAGEGGWPSIPEGDTLDPGMRDPRVVALRGRLAAAAPMLVEAKEPALFDKPLEEAVRSFQARNGLAVDGRVGRKTLKALNRSVEDLIQIVQANLERWRWLPRDLGDRYVLVNVPDYRLRAVKDGEVALETPVVVGTPNRPTPLFSREMKYLVANPTWTVPPTIFAQDYLPRLRQDPGYLAQKNITLYASWSGSAAPVDPYGVNWHDVSASTRSLSWRLVQAPGPHNALGKVKFMLPNRHSVYLHDTPEKRLFERAGRALSSGCVRVGDPDALADLVLRDTAGWDDSRLQQVYARGQTTRINLARHWPVYIAYFTTWVDDQGALHAYDDVYGRDAELIDSLDGLLLLAEEPAAGSGRS